MWSASSRVSTPFETPLPDSKPEIKARAQSLMPEQRAGDFVQALMDLGATICTPKTPNCLICPWIEECDGRKQGIAQTLPRKRPKKAVPTRKGHAYFAQLAMAGFCCAAALKKAFSAA